MEDHQIEELIEKRVAARLDGLRIYLEIEGRDVLRVTLRNGQHQLIDVDTVTLPLKTES